MRSGIPLVAFTYNEPAVYFEYAYDTARLAQAAGLRTVFVSSGFETVTALDTIAPYLDAINVDLKAFDAETYRSDCGSRLAPVLRNIRHLWAAGIWTEVTTLVIPGLNDSDDELQAIAAFLAATSPDLPWHVSGFVPHYQMQHRPPTPAATLRLPGDRPGGGAALCLYWQHLEQPAVGRLCRHNLPRVWGNGDQPGWLSRPHLLAGAWCVPPMQ